MLCILTRRQYKRGNTNICDKVVTETDFTAVGVNNHDIKATYPNQYPLAGIPIIPQQTPGSYTQAGVPYQAGSP